MLSSTLSTAALLLSTASLVSAQTFTDCDPTKKSCPADPGLGGTLVTDFTKLTEGDVLKDWSYVDGTKLEYDSTNGALFKITSNVGAPVLYSNKYIQFGVVDAWLKASPGTGIVSSFILESDDLDEVDWEWLGSNDGSVESNFFGKGNTTTYDRAIYHDMKDPIGTLTKYTIDWTAERLIWKINDNVVRTLPYSDPLALGGRNYPQTPMRVRMGNWVGCKDAAAATDPKTKGTCDWAGGPISNTFPYTMTVAKVSITDQSCGGDYTYSDMSGSFGSIKSTCAKDSASTPAGSKSSTTQAATKSSSTGAVLIQTTQSSNASSTASVISSAPTTLTTATPGNVTGTGTISAGGSKTSSSATSTPTTNAAPGSKHQYGVMDFGVIALGLGLGYLVM